jgi:uncharacterized protein (TIGR00369 family)
MWIQPAGAAPKSTPVSRPNPPVISPYLRCAPQPQGSALCASRRGVVEGASDQPAALDRVHSLNGVLPDSRYRGDYRKAEYLVSEVSSKEETIFDSLGDRPQVAELIDWTIVRLDRDTDSIYLSFTALPTFTNPAGNVHGGFIVAMLDECMGSAIVGIKEAEFLPVTISMSTDFIRPVLPGKVLGEGRITSMGKSSAFLEGKLLNVEGKLLARATATYRLLPFRDSVKK